eukprot:CAMPEP_0194752078 /NCGR_PEP_ID=MMETSP0323_2-20130528/5929_1 /TAXON_ID=2866 ORGANISM="Crypthecodinium cohnii, Strain Seligo" /NCGR_SAMPLE_ID=MMETSP0323_2 /ASSEMBLY_ACC=CAM_ASM_000346 /LENGTH=30 /DNA_ID= /DNA_START= /DNA_END= /DNA_ORIENTATION=
MYQRREGDRQRRTCQGADESHELAQAAWSR